METEVKKIFLALILLVPNSLVRANEYPLSAESKQFIITSAAAGAILAGGIGLIAALEKQDQQKHSKHKSTWEKITSFPWHYVILPALAGAATAGFVASFFTAEEYLKSGQKELALLETDRMVTVAMESGDASDLRRITSFKSFPSLSAYERLEVLLTKIAQAKDYMVTVIKSGTTGLSSIARALLDRLNAIEKKIIDAMAKLKDSQYFKELAIRTEIDYKNHLLETARRAAAAAEAQARAAQSAAHAAWHTAHHHTHPVYVAPPPVYVHVKR